MISVKNLSKYYGHEKAVDGISFEIKKGEIVGFLGPNGAGKTTTMKILTCYMPPTNGTVRIASMDPLDESVEIRRRIGYLPENTPLYEEMKVGEYLRFLADMHGLSGPKRTSSIQHVIEVCGLHGKVRNEIGTLSKGYHQRVGLAQALIHDPDILVMDEPTSGLDPNQIIEIRNLIKEIGKKKTIILSTHILPEVEATCNRVLIIHKGKIVGEGTPDELRSRAASKTLIHIEVDGPLNTVISKLKTLHGVEAVRKRDSEEKGVAALAVEIAKDVDLRRNINHFLLDNGFELLGMSRQSISMEDVFTKLTRS